jgi:hypothetical protein
MDLKDFISITLTSIKDGVAEANKNSNNAFKIYTAAKVVDFDIAVEVSNEGKTGAGGGLKIHVVEARVGKDSTTKESNVSRIHFTVGLNTSVS